MMAFNPTVYVHDVLLFSVLLSWSLPMMHSFAPPMDAVTGWGSRQNQKAFATINRIAHESLTSTRKTNIFYQEEIMAEAKVVKRKSGIRVMSRKVSSKKPSNVYTVASSQEYRDIIDKFKESNIIITRFYAKWCKACLATTPLFNRLATNNPSIIFVEVAIQSENSDLYEGLKIPSIPFSHIYYPSAGVVEEMQLSKKRWPIYEKVVATYVQAYCTIENANYSSHMICENFVPH